MKEYVTAITTWSRSDLLPMAISSVRDDCFVFDNKESGLDSLAGAWNHIIRSTVVDGEYESVIIMHDDCQAIGNTAKAMHKFRTQVFDPRQVVMITGYNVRLYGDRGIVNIDSANEICDMSCFCVGRELTEEVGYFDEQFKQAWFEDRDMHKRISDAGLKIMITVPVYHLGGGTTEFDEEGAQLKNKYFYDNYIKYCNKWGGPPGEETK